MITVELEQKEKDTYLKLPDIPDAVLPPVTIVTPTLNRYKEFPIAIRNWKNTNYPRSKLYWVIIDDSSEENFIKLKELLENEVKNELDSGNIKLFHFNQSENNNKKFTIGKKRNLC